MPIVNRIAAVADEVAGWRRDFHRHPELGLETERTSGIVAGMLHDFGCDEVITGLAQTGVVGVIKGRSNHSGTVIGLRADMDALPIHEATGLAHASATAGRMHACGHDGHTAMLLGAARHLAETRNFDGTVVVIFQPGEEGAGGGRLMIEQGLMQQFGIQEVYGMHNWPGVPVGHFAIRKGPLMAAADRFNITIRGRGAHAAQPHLGVDPIAIGCQIQQALQTIVARNIDPLDAAVISVTMFQAGSAHNIIPDGAMLAGTVRTLRKATQDFIVERMRATCDAIARQHGAAVDFEFLYGVPATFNHDVQTSTAAAAATVVAGADNVDTATLPTMAGEDFSLMLEARPGAMIFIGNGDSAGLHHPAYDFSDDAIPAGVSYWVKLAELRMPV